MAYEPHLNWEKFKELVLYIARKCAQDDGFGKTKLNKVLWWSDFRAFAELGAPITGAKYMRLPWGPVPKPLLPALEELGAQGLIDIDETETHGGHMQERVQARRPPKMALFSKAEIGIVDRVVDALWDKRAVGVSNLSHKKSVGWRLTADREIIPYETVFVSSRKAKPADRDWAKKTAKLHGWL